MLTVVDNTKYFTKLDQNQEHQQLKVNEENAKILTSKFIMLEGKFVAYKITRKGIMPTGKKVKVIYQTPKFRNKQEL